MSVVKCPGCQTELDPTNTNCPVCLRPRSRKELLEGLKETRKPAPLRLGRVLLPLIIVGGLGAAGYYYATLPKPVAAMPAAPPPQAAAPAPAPSPAPAAPAPSPSDPGLSAGNPGNTVMVRQTPSNSVLEAAGGPEARELRHPREIPIRRHTGWMVSGQIYDLMSLKPVPGAKIAFQDRNSGKAFTGTTSASGRYAVELPKVEDGGYEVTVAKRGYTNTWLEEMSPPYRSQSRSRRLEAAEQASESAVLHVPLLPESSQSQVSYDLVLFPRQ